jgi:hypothetical protein
VFFLPVSAMLELLTLRKMCWEREERLRANWERYEGKGLWLLFDKGSYNDTYTHQLLTSQATVSN